MAVVVVVAAAVLSLTPLWTPAPAGSAAPPQRFSAARAMAHLPRVAGTAHPTGSEQQQRVRRYLTDRLRALGLEPSVDTVPYLRAFRDDTHIGGTVSNISARVPGRDSTGRVLLVAHYDSVRTGPGASDDGANVAALLEITRAITAGSPPRNDIEVLFTDGEEAGLLGSSAYAGCCLGTDPTRTVVVNLEARGTSGPALVFQTLGGSSALTPAVAESGAFATSLADAVYRLLPNDTDLTPLADAGARGINLAFIGDSARYHSAQDSVGNVSPDSVQSMGDAVMAAVSVLDGADLDTLAAGDDTYFSVGGLLPRYPRWLEPPSALLALLCFAGLLILARRHGLRPVRVATAAAAFVLVPVAAAAAGVAVWSLLLVFRPANALLQGPDPFRPTPFVLTGALLAVGAIAGWHRWMRRRRTASEVTAAVIGWLAVLGVVTAVLVPGASYLFAWPALVAAVVAMVTPLVRTPWAIPLLRAVSALPVVLLALPAVVVLVPTLGVVLGAGTLVVAVLFAATGVDLLPDRLPRRAGVAAAGTLVLVAVLLFGAGVAMDGASPSRPRPVDLAYAVDADTGDASWVGRGPGDPVTDPLLTSDPGPIGDRFPNLVAGEYRTGPAPATGAELAPELTVVGTDTAGGTRTVRVTITAPPGTLGLDVYVDTTGGEVRRATVNGADLPGGRNREFAGTRWNWGFGYVGVPPAGLPMTLEMAGAGPVVVRVVAERPGLPAGHDPFAGRDDVMAAPYPSTAGMTFCARTFRV